MFVKHKASDCVRRCLLESEIFDDKIKDLNTLNFVFAVVCTRLGEPGETWFSQFRVCFCFSLAFFLMTIHQANLGEGVRRVRGFFRLYSVSNGVQLCVVRREICL